MKNFKRIDQFIKDNYIKIPIWQMAEGASREGILTSIKQVKSRLCKLGLINEYNKRWRQHVKDFQGQAHYIR